MSKPDEPKLDREEHKVHQVLEVLRSFVVVVSDRFDKQLGARLDELVEPERVRGPPADRVAGSFLAETANLLVSLLGAGRKAEEEPDSEENHHDHRIPR